MYTMMLSEAACSKSAAQKKKKTEAQTKAMASTSARKFECTHTHTN